ncbi:MAG: phosphodiester glycosidase family protein [Candidatus Poribacteria bacterium]|nr:phosphodiester glycosidase family protein [Candidatus Poribacteria bacterium]
MFDITYLGRRCFRFIRCYPRTWITIGFLLILGIGIWAGVWVGRTSPPWLESTIIDSILSGINPAERSDVTKSVARGVVHRQIQDKGMLTNILAVSPDVVDIRPYRALSAGIGTETLVSLARRHEALAAINGGFFEMVGTFRGESVGALKIDGEWISEPEQGRAVIGLRTIDRKIKASIDRIALRQELVIPSGKRLPIDGMNRNRGENELVIYHPHFHVVTLTMPDGVEAVVRNGEVVSIHEGQGSLRIPADGYVLSASGKRSADLLTHISEGDTVQIRETIIPERVGDSDLWASFAHIIGGGPLLLQDGVASSTKSYEQEGFDRAFHSFWHPRTAIGKKADGTLLFVTITATEAGVRRGVMLPRLAELLLEWGATDALNLDGGHSSMLVIRDEIVSVKKKDPARDKSPDKLEGKKGQVEKNTKTPRGNRRIRPMPKQQGRAISDAILIFSRF